MPACESSRRQQESSKRRSSDGRTEYNGLTRLREFMSSDQNNGKRKPTENNQSLFSVPFDFI